jgi:phosphoglycolate phosphatase-like HAD superfamily hydrolase
MTKINEKINDIIRTLELLPNEIAVIGDGEDDFLSANLTGCKFYPVGEARGVNSNQKVFTLAELLNEFTR